MVAGVGNLAGKFMAENGRVAHPSRLAAAQDANVSATNGGGANLDQKVARRQLRVCHSHTADFVHSL